MHATEVPHRISYKPGYTLDMLPPRNTGDMFTITSESRIPGQWTFVVKFETEDSFKPGGTWNGSVYFSDHPPHCISPIGDITDRALFFDWIRDCFIRLERHESREWFKIDGKMYDDPHQGNPNRLE